MNIAFIMNGAKPPRGGEILTSYLITHLRKDFFHPILVYANEGVIVQEIKKHGIDSIQIKLDKKITNIYPREIKIYNPLFIISFLWRLIAGGYINKLRKLLKSNEIDLIYCADNLSKLIGGIAGKMTGIKVVAHCHDDFKEDVLGKLMRKFNLILLDRIITVSEKVRSFFRHKGKISEKVVTIYNGIDIFRFDPEKITGYKRDEFGLERSSFVIGSIGILEKDKGQNFLVEAIDRLKSDEVLDISCIICGEGPEEANLRKLVNYKGLGKNIFFLGFRDDIPRIMKMIDLIVITSLTIESFSLVAAEGMAMKVPVIATRVGGLPEVLDDGKTGIIIPPADVDALCNSIKYLIENPSVRFDMGIRGRKRVLDLFTIEKNARQTEKLFVELLNS